MNWKPGDRALIVYSPDPSFIGKLCTVLGIFKNHPVVFFDQIFRWSVAIQVSIDGFTDRDGFMPGYGFKPHWLRKLDEDDSRKVVSWDECVFKPGTSRSFLDHALFKWATQKVRINPVRPLYDWDPKRYQK